VAAIIFEPPRCEENLSHLFKRRIFKRKQIRLMGFIQQSGATHPQNLIFMKLRICCLLLPILLFSACGTLEVRVDRTRTPDVTAVPKVSRVKADVFFLYPSWQP